MTNIITKPINYKAGNISCKGVLAYDDASSHKRPLVLVVHDWGGCNEFAIDKAKEIAQLGYIGFAIDVYGDGTVGTTKDEKAALIQPFMRDRALLLTRIESAYQTALQVPHADTTKIGGIGFCFGGLCILDLARSGAPLKGVVSFHGLLNAPSSPTSTEIKAKILALHGYDDPMVKSNDVMTFANEMNACHADWQIHLYGHTMHAFTNPEANDPAFGTVYNALAKKRAWQSMANFFHEVFE